MKGSFLLITANVGSLFEESCRIHGSWLDTLLHDVYGSNADFVAIHMQEVGGKNYEECTDQVPDLVKKIARCLSTIGYTTGRAYLDLEYKLPDTYVALGCLFFVKDSCPMLIEQYDFKAAKYTTLEKDFLIVERGLNKCTKLRKAKFPKHFWPTIKWTRKGFMHCRFRFNRTPIDFVNVHLFHDESNIALIHENPSLYSENRKRALNYVLDEMQGVGDGERDVFFIFGDLNFRLDHASFLNRITEDADQRHDSLESTDGLDTETGSLLTVESASNNHMLTPHDRRDGDHLRRTVSAIEFRRSPNGSRKELQTSCVLRIEKKRFDYFNHKRLLKEWQGYLEDDKEVQHFSYLRELKIRFPPTYPWSEDPEDSEMLMKTRAPAWCDRILMNSNAFDLVCSDQHARYDCIGKDVCMGDHKPVCLTFIADL